jgi:TPR repeat protein
MTRLEAATREAIEGAAQGGAPEALFQLGLMYCSGREVDLNLVLAHKWFNLAALRGVDEAKRYRAEVARELSRSEIAHAQKLAREWLAKH